MGSRNPDRIPLSARRSLAQTVQQMRDQRWDLHAKCLSCGHLFRVDLATIIKVRGPTFSLWNQRARCRSLGCPGWVEFQAKAPGMHWHEPLRAPDRRP